MMLRSMLWSRAGLTAAVNVKDGVPAYDYNFLGLQRPLVRQQAAGTLQGDDSLPFRLRRRRPRQNNGNLGARLSFGDYRKGGTP